MDYFKPTFGVEPTNKYDKAKLDFIQAINSFQGLSQQEQQALLAELFGVAKVAAILN